MKNKIEEHFEKLYLACSEEEVIIHLKNIIKGFNVSVYKDKIMDNPYFNMLVKDIKGDILSEITLVKDNIESEIRGIEDALGKPISIGDFNKLKELKRECMGLLYEVNDRINEIILL